MNNEFVNFIRRAIQPLRDKIILLAGRIVIASVNDSEKVQQLQISALAGEAMDKVERFQHFGFTSNPPAGTEGIGLALGGNRDNMVVIATENRALRKKELAPGEAAIYTADGTYVHVKMNGQVEIKTAVKVTVDAPDTEFTGNVKILKKLDVIEDTKLFAKLEVVDDAKFDKNIMVAINAQVAALVQAGGYAGPVIGANEVNINVPVKLGAAAVLTSQAAITSTAIITGNAVKTAAGADLDTLRTKYNAHKHTETGTITTVPDQLA